MKAALTRIPFLSLLALATSLQAQTSSPLHLHAEHPIAMRGGTGAIAVTLENTASTGTIPLALTAGPVIDEVTHTEVPGAKASIVALPGAEVPATLAAQQSITLEAKITGVSAASTTSFFIFNAGLPIQADPVFTFAGDAPMAFSVDGIGTADKPIPYTRNQPVAIPIKNPDPQSYHLYWILQIDNKTEQCSDLYLPAGGTALIQLNPTSNPFSPSDFVHPAKKTGTLYLSLIDSAQSQAKTAAKPVCEEKIPVRLLPSRTLPVTLAMHPVSRSWQTVDSYLFAGCLLLLGGLFSFLGSTVLPNWQTRGELRARLQVIANRTSTVSVLVDSYLRVLLRLERNRIDDLIRNAPIAIPAAVGPLELASTLIDTLTKRLAGAERLDDLRRKHDLIAATAPPSITDNIDAILQAAADQLHSSTLSESDIAQANALFTKAQAALDMLADSDATAKLVAANVSAVMSRLDHFPKEYCSDLLPILPGIFIMADPARGYNDAKNLVRPMLFAIDHGVAAIHLALDYSILRASIPVVPKATSTSTGNVDPAAGNQPLDEAGALIRARLLKRQNVLVDLLGTLSWRALRDATLLVQEMREDTYEEDILAELTRPNQAEIAIDTQTARPFQPAFFSIKFKNARYNDSAALQRLICRWVFPTGIEEFTWKVCHYFSGSEPPTIPPEGFEFPKDHVRAATPAPSRMRRMLSRKKSDEVMHPIDIFATIRGQQLNESREVPVPALWKVIQIRERKAPERSQLYAEILRFAIAFGVALAGLLSGALEQLNKLDVIPASIAIIALGFSASSIKNLLTQAPSK